MVAIMLALALTLATVGMTTPTQHALAFWGGGYYCEAPWARHDPNCYNYSTNNQPTYTQTYAQDCSRPDSNCYNNGYIQPLNPTPTSYISVAPDGFSCYGEWRCASGWNHAIVDAPRDYANNNYDPSCNDHTQAYCNGYTQGYVYAWNIEVNNQNPSQSQQTIQQQGCTIIGSPGSTCTQTEQSAQGQDQ